MEPIWLGDILPRFQKTPSSKRPSNQIQTRWHCLEWSLYSSQPRRQLKPIPSALYRFGPLESEWMHTTTYTFCADTKNVYDRFRELPKKINKLNKNRCLYVQGFQSDHSSVPPNLQYKWKLFKFEGKAEKKQPFIFDCPRTLSRNWALRMEPGWKR